MKKAIYTAAFMISLVFANFIIADDMSDSIKKALESLELDGPGKNNQANIPLRVNEETRRRIELEFDCMGSLSGAVIAKNLTTQELSIKRVDANASGAYCALLMYYGCCEVGLESYTRGNTLVIINGQDHFFQGHNCPFKLKKFN